MKNDRNTPKREYAKPELQRFGLMARITGVVISGGGKPGNRVDSNITKAPKASDG